MKFKMINKIFVCVFIFGLFFITLNCRAQNHYLFESDSSFIYSGPIELGNSQHYFSIFRTGIEDGTWYYCPTSKKDTNKCKLNYRAKVTIKNGMKQGVLEYTHPYDNKTPQFQVNYVNDTLHGYFIETGFAAQKVSEGHYEMGKKNGLFIDYFEKRDKKESVKELQLYSNDTLIYWQCYNHKEKIRAIGECIYPEKKCECVYYDTLGVMYLKGYFNNFNELYKVQYYNSSGAIEKELTGDFKKSNQYLFSSYRLREIGHGLSVIELLNGTIRYFSNGEQTREIIKTPD